MSRISVALCTFNGSEYLNDQLKSIAWQTRQPDELIICDDRSSDDTGKLVDEFSRHVQFPVRFFTNEKNLGVTKNFDKAISLCTGDLIALSDQDDVWHCQKLEYYERIFEKGPVIGALFSNAEVVDEFLNPLGYDIWQKSNFTKDKQQRLMNGEAIAVLLKHYIVTGATVIFRTDFKPAILPIPEFWFHDAWIALLMASISNLAFISEPMIKYRQHSSNLLGGVKKNVMEEIKAAFHINRSKYYQLELLRHNVLYHRILSLKNDFNISKDIFMLEDKIEHLQLRQNMPRKRFLRLPFIAGELRKSRYAKYTRNWGSVAMDLLFR